MGITATVFLLTNHGIHSEHYILNRTLTIQSIPSDQNDGSRHHDLRKLIKRSEDFFFQKDNKTEGRNNIYEK